jgi:hypothetical protein
LHEHQLTGLDVKKIYHGFLELLTCSLSNRGGNGHNIGDVMMMSGPNVFRKLEDIKKSLHGRIQGCQQLTNKAGKMLQYQVDESIKVENAELQ